MPSYSVSDRGLSTVYPACPATLYLIEGCLRNLLTYFLIHCNSLVYNFYLFECYMHVHMSFIDPGSVTLASTCTCTHVHHRHWISYIGKYMYIIDTGSVTSRAYKLKKRACNAIVHIRTAKF